MRMVRREPIVILSPLTSAMQAFMGELVNRGSMGIARMVAHAEGEVSQARSAWVDYQSKHHAESACRLWQIDLQTSRKSRFVVTLLSAGP